MKELTKLQTAVLNFIQTTYRKTGNEPTFREIAEFTDRTVRSAAQHVEALEKKGYIERSINGIKLKEEYIPKRGITIYDPDTQTLTNETFNHELIDPTACDQYYCIINNEVITFYSIYDNQPIATMAIRK